MSAPSDSRWSAFSVRPPSARTSSVVATVSKRNAASSASRSAAGSVGIAAAVRAWPRHTASATWRARYAGSPRSTNHASSSSGVRPDSPGRWLTFHHARC